MISTAAGQSRRGAANQTASTSAPVMTTVKGASSLSSHHQARSSCNHNKSDYSGNGSKHHQQHTLAPLASLDYSISDPVMSSSTDTPTLSGYFDYDQLSDMIDDSLFEITNAGCLSKSVFVVGHKCSQGPSKLLSQLVTTTTSMNDKKQDLNEQDDGQRTPTNEAAEPVEIPSGDLRSDQRSQAVAMLANHRAYDYSSTSTVPNQTRVSSSGAHRQRSKSTRATSSLAASAERAQVNQKVARRKVRSQTDLINRQLEEKLNGPVKTDWPLSDTADDEDDDADQDSLCSACRQSQTNEPDRSNKKRAKQKKRFTFSLFNLFTSSGPFSSSSSQHDKEQCCCYLKRSQQILKHKSGNTIRPGLSSSTTTMNHRNKPPARQENSRGRTRNGPSSSSGGPIRSRDSIKLINQRKMRNSSAAAAKDDASGREVRGCLSMADFQEGLRDSELLLDLSQTDARLSNDVQFNEHQQPLRLSQSSYTFSSANWPSNLDPQRDLAHSMLNRQTKSVKFTTPDRVMILPGKSSKNSSNLPPADLQPIAPIIKNRKLVSKQSVRKLSTYSQTDSSKNLDELLAKFEQNNQLITEINEKLKLTETIASSKSALDQQASGDDLINDIIKPDQSTPEDIQHGQIAPNSTNIPDDYADLPRDWIAEQRTVA